MIRPAAAEDTPAILSLTAGTGVFKPYEVDVLREILDDYHAGNAGDEHVATVCERDGEVVGYAYYAPDVMTDRSWYLYWIAVRADLHGKGVGREIMAAFEADVKRRDGRVVFVEVSSMPHSEGTRAFYSALGYAVTGVLEDFYSDGDNMVVFRKRMS